MTTSQLADGSDKSGSPPPAAGVIDKAVDGAADPLSGLDTGSREWAGKNGVKSLSDAIKTAREAQGLIGRSVQLPADDAKPDDVDTYVKKATAKYRPEKADGYEFKLPDGVPKEMPYDADGATEFKGIAHELGLTKTQAQKAHDWFVSRQAGAFQKAADGLVEKAGSATQALEKAFGGAQDSDAFKEAILSADKGIAEISKAAKLADGELMTALKDANLIGPGGIILSPAIARVFAHVGKFYAEDKLIDGKGGSVNNPFAAGGENMTEQNRLAKADPEKARRLIRQAGREKDYPSLFKT